MKLIELSSYCFHDFCNKESQGQIDTHVTHVNMIFKDVQRRVHRNAVSSTSFWTLVEVRSVRFAAFSWSSCTILKAIDPATGAAVVLAAILKAFLGTLCFKVKPEILGQFMSNYVHAVSPHCLLERQCLWDIDKQTAALRSWFLWRSSSKWNERTLMRSK